jgi:hypothetical protein
LKRTNVNVNKVVWMRLLGRLHGQSVVKKRLCASTERLMRNHKIKIVDGCKRSSIHDNNPVIDG